MSDWLLPELDELTQPFWEGCSKGELRVQQCPQTLRLIHPPRHRSPYAPRLKPVWTTLAGTGSIWSVAEPHPPLIPQFAAVAPYNIILVSASEDPAIRFVGNLLRDAKAPINSVGYADIAIGTPVRVVFQPVAAANGVTYHMPRWVRREST